MLPYFDLGFMDVWIPSDEVARQDGPEELWRMNRVLLCQNIGGLFHRISRYDYAIIGFRIALSTSVDAHCHHQETYDVSICPDKRMQTVISVTSWLPVFSSLFTLNKRMLSLPY